MCEIARPFKQHCIESILCVPNNEAGTLTLTYKTETHKHTKIHSIINLPQKGHFFSAVPGAVQTQHVPAQVNHSCSTVVQRNINKGHRIQINCRCCGNFIVRTRHPQLVHNKKASTLINTHQHINTYIPRYTLSNAQTQTNTHTYTHAHTTHL